MANKTTSVVGLDIGAYTIKWAEVLHLKDGYELAQAKTTLIGGSIKNALLELIKNFPEMPKKIRVAVSGPSLLIRRLELPIMTKQELKSAIRFEAEKHIPFPIDDCVLDFQILKQNAAERTMTVLLVAAKKDLIQGQLKLLQEAGIEPELIDVDIFCALNALELTGAVKDKKAFGLINIGHTITSLAIVDEGLPFLVREISRGTADVTNELAKMRNVSELEAEKLKQDHADDIKEDLVRASRIGFEPLAEEIRHSVSYFEHESGQTIEALWIAGGGALCEGAAEALADELGKPVFVWDGSGAFKVADTLPKDFFQTQGSQYAVALGMGVRKL